MRVSPSDLLPSLALPDSAGSYILRRVGAACGNHNPSSEHSRKGDSRNRDPHWFTNQAWARLCSSLRSQSQGSRSTNLAFLSSASIRLALSALANIAPPRR